EVADLQYFHPAGIYRNKATLQVQNLDAILAVLDQPRVEIGRGDRTRRCCYARACFSLARDGFHALNYLGFQVFYTIPVTMVSTSNRLRTGPLRTPCRRKRRCACRTIAKPQEPAKR